MIILDWTHCACGFGSCSALWDFNYGTHLSLIYSQMFHPIRGLAFRAASGDTLLWSGDVSASWISPSSVGTLYTAAPFTTPLHLGVGAHSSATISCVNRNSPRLSGSPLPVWLCFSFFFLSFPFSPSCLCSCYNLLCSTTPWQHIRGGLPLSGVWSVSNSLTLWRSLCWMLAAVSCLTLLSPQTFAFV